jgi:hypothetical protein
MREYQTAFLGGTAFKNMVRKKRPSEDEKLHYDVVANTAALPVSRYVVDQINDTVFSQPVHRDLEFCSPQGREIEDELDWTELVCYDADMNNQSMDQFMSGVGQLSSIFGHCWVFVDMPSVEQGTSGRPYVTTVNPLQVWDWHHTMVNGRYIPSHVKVCEYEDAHEYVFKCYYLGTVTDPSRWESYRVIKLQSPDAEAEFIAEGKFPAGMSIPGFVAFTRRDPRFIDLGVSDIDAASDVQREIYKLETEAYQSVQFAKTLIRADAGIKVPAHAGGIIRGPEGSVETMTVDTQDVHTIIAKQQDLLEGLEAMSGLGGLRQSKDSNQSGVAIIQERASLHKMACAKARELEVCEEYIWTYMARFMGIRWAGEVEYGTNYAETDTKLKIAKLQVANQLSGTNPVIKSIIDQAVLELLVDGEERSMWMEKLKTTQTVNANGVATPMVTIDEPEENEIESRDLGNQTPREIPEHDVAIIDDTSATMDTSITYTGISSYNPVADSLIARAGGR